MKAFRKGVTYLFIVALALLAALNYRLFIFPNRFAPSGINGICTMIQYIFGINLGYLSLLINIPLAWLAFRKVGKSLASRGMLYVAAFSLALIVLEDVDLSRFAYETANGTSRILGPLIAGCITGFTYAQLVRLSGCTGGMDFVSAVIHKYNPEMNFFTINFALNVAVAVSSYFVYDYEMEPVILCILNAFMSTTVSDKMMRGSRSAVRFEIITDYPKEISKAIIEKLHHSATLVPAKGMYKGREKNILICVVNNAQVANLSAIIRKFPNTFAVMSNVSSVMGNFRHINKEGNREVPSLDVGDGKQV